MKIELSVKEIKYLHSFQKLCDQVNELREYPFEKFTYKYEIFFTGIGTGCRVKCVELEVVKDITDYDLW